MANDPEQQNDPFENPLAQQVRLWRAAERGDCSEIRRALVCGANPDARDEDGRTAINIASQAGFPEAVRTLLAGRQMARLYAAGLAGPETDIPHRDHTGHNRDIRHAGAAGSV